jgi:hypothetical protein
MRLHNCLVHSWVFQPAMPGGQTADRGERGEIRRRRPLETAGCFALSVLLFVVVAAAPSDDTGKADTAGQTSVATRLRQAIDPRKRRGRGFDRCTGVDDGDDRGHDSG